MLIAAYQFKDSGIDTEFDTCSGITVFVPCDNTFYNPRSVISQFASLSKQNESMVMKYHVIRGYYPPTPFPSSISKPTLATEMMGLGNFLLKISKANDSVTVSTDIVKAKVTRIVFDKSPIGIYVVSKMNQERRHVYNSVGRKNLKIFIFIKQQQQEEQPSYNKIKVL
ncbi:hypothetical protein P8452_13013 [Trifolium repens]|nr:hypothetical protein P8452_13013 [Trifolium repens]